jgi:hypothetical protein
VPDKATNYFRVPGWLRQQAGLGRIGRDARSPARTAYGLAIENVERAHLTAQVVGAADYTGLNATSWTALDATNLQWRVWTSGKRPVEFLFSVLGLAPAGQTLYLSFLWDGAEVTGTTEGMTVNVISSALAKMHGFHTMVDVGAGEHTLSLAYKVSGGSGTVYNNQFRIFVSAKEI